MCFVTSFSWFNKYDYFHVLTILILRKSLKSVKCLKRFRVVVSITEQLVFVWSKLCASPGTGILILLLVKSNLCVCVLGVRLCAALEDIVLSSGLQQPLSPLMLH